MKSTSKTTERMDRRKEKFRIRIREVPDNMAELKEAIRIEGELQMWLK